MTQPDKLYSVVDYGKPGGDCTAEVTYKLNKDGTQEVVNIRFIEPKPPIGRRRNG